MVFCLLLVKYLKLKRALRRVKHVKLNAYRESIGLPPKYDCCETCFRLIQSGLKTIFLKLFCFCLFIKSKKGVSLWENIWRDGTISNSVAKSLFGFIVGLIFTHLFIIFLIFQLNFDPVTTTYGSMVFGFFLTLGLAFSETSRCFVFLTVPQFFTKKGRAAILAYCLILALSGPGKNTTKNMEVLTESLLCSQDMAHNATQGLIDLVKDPYTALGGTMKSMVDAVQAAATRIMGGLKILIDVIKSVVNAIKFVLNWLKQITEFCNERVGTPSAKCRAAFDVAVLECKDRLGVFAWMCTVADLAKNLCKLAELGEDFLCWFPNLIKQSVFDPIGKGLKNFGGTIKTFFDVRIRFNYELSHSITSSKGFREIVHGMKLEIMKEIHWLIDYMDWVNLLVSLFMGLALYKAIIYRHRFLNLDRHDNFFITKGIVKLDMRRRRIDRSPIFPLKYRESFTFVQPFSLILVESERTALKRQLFFITIATIKILSYVLIDYVFYKFILLVEKYGAIHLDTRQILSHAVKIDGEGFMADMYRAILFALSPIGALLPVFDTTPCLPVPTKPNYYRYAMIFFLLFVCFMACVTEPFIMRLRHIICEIYYPHRKGPRDRWLYTHILSSRGNFASYARTELKSLIWKNAEKRYSVGIIDRLMHTSPCFRKIISLLRMRRKKCFLCGLSGDLDDMENFFNCPSCETVYCNSCYNELDSRCVVCMSPIEFGDISEESRSDSNFSEDEEMERAIAQVLKRRQAGRESPVNPSPSHEKIWKSNSYSIEKTEKEDLPMDVMLPTSSINGSRKTRETSFIDMSPNTSKGTLSNRKVRITIKNEVRSNEDTEEESEDASEVEETDVTSEVEESYVASQVEQTDVASDVEESYIASEVEETDVASEVEESYIASEVEETDVTSEVEGSYIASQVEQTDVASDVEESYIASEVEETDVASEVEEFYIASEEEETNVASDVEGSDATTEIEVSDVASEVEEDSDTTLEVEESDVTSEVEDSEVASVYTSNTEENRQSETNEPEMNEIDRNSKSWIMNKEKDIIVSESDSSENESEESKVVSSGEISNWSTTETERILSMNKDGEASQFSRNQSSNKSNPSETSVLNSPAYEIYYDFQPSGSEGTHISTSSTSRSRMSAFITSSKRNNDSSSSSETIHFQRPPLTSDDEQSESDSTDDKVVTERKNTQNFNLKINSKSKKSNIQSDSQGTKAFKKQYGESGPIIYPKVEQEGENSSIIEARQRDASSGTIAEKIAALDSFYSLMPYPPFTNIYK